MKTCVLLVALLVACSGKKEGAPAAGSNAATSETVAAPVATFWSWFATNAEALRTNTDMVKVMEQISAELAKLSPEVFAEIGGEGDARTLVLSAGGKRDQFPLVQSLYAARPTVKGWTIVAFRQRSKAGEAMQIQIAGKQMDPAAVKIVATPSGGKLELDVFLPGALSDDDRAQIGFLLLDHSVGEYDMETKIGGLQFLPIEKAPATARPLSELPGLVDAIK